jgi:hypothetical protein
LAQEYAYGGISQVYKYTEAIHIEEPRRHNSTTHFARRFADLVSAVSPYPTLAGRNLHDEVIGDLRWNYYSYTKQVAWNYSIPNIVNALLGESRDFAFLVRRPRVSAIPPSPVPHYIERHSISQRIEQGLLHNDNRTDPPVVLILGLTQTGKSQLARRYVNQHGSKYQHIFWIDARDPESIYWSFRGFADAMGLIIQDDYRPYSKDLATELVVLNCLAASDTRCLVVAENMDDPFLGIPSVVSRRSRLQHYNYKSGWV